MFYNELDGKTYSSLGGMNRTFRKFGYTSKMYYDKFLKMENDGICVNCGLETTFTKFKYKKFCGIKCSTEFNLDKRKPHTQETKDKLSKSWVGRDNSSMMVKRTKTIEEKYKMTETEFKRMLFNNRLNDMSLEEKTKLYDKATSSRRGGGKRFKQYILNGETILVQGYEPYVLDILKRNIEESRISAGRNIGFIRYIGPDNIQHRYFSDILVDKKILIEVKSPYTLTTDKNLSNKLEAAKNAGYIPLLLVLEPKQIEMCEKNLIETISSQALNQYEGRFNDYPFIGVGYKQMITEVLGIHYNIDGL